jgi:hypothetical protein
LKSYDDLHNNQASLLDNVNLILIIDTGTQAHIIENGFLKGTSQSGLWPSLHQPPEGALCGFNTFQTNIQQKSP